MSDSFATGETAATPLRTAPIPAHVPSSVVREDRLGVVPAAILAGIGTAVAGGLMWAGVVIATKYDIGILAWFIGAATGTVMFRLSGGTVTAGTRIAAGALAAGGLMIGKYVIFVHAVKTTLDLEFAGQGVSVGYADPQMIRFFVNHFGEVVRPIYAVWALFAVIAAVRTAGGSRLFGRGRGRGA